MSVDRLEQFISDLETALTKALNLDDCEVRLVDRPYPGGPTFQSRAGVMTLPLVAGDRTTVGCVYAVRAGGVLTEREEITLPPKLAAAAEQIMLIKSGASLTGDVMVEQDADAQLPAEREEFESLLRAQEMVAQQEEIDETLQAIVTELERLLSVATAHVYTVDSDDGILVNRVGRIGGRPFQQTFVTIPIGEGLLGSTILSGEPAHIPNSHQDPRSFYPPDAEPLMRLLGESVMVAPLRSAGEVNGAIFVSRIGHRRFSEHEFHLFRLFAGHVELAFDKALRLGRERSNRRSAELLSSLATNLAALDAEPVVLHSVTEAVRDLTGAQQVSVSVLDRAEQHTLEASITGDGQVRIFRPASVARQHATEALHGTRSSSGDDDVGDSRYRPITLPRSPDYGSEALTVPIAGSSGVLGQIWAAKPDGPRRCRDVSEYLESLASIAAVTLERIRARDHASELEDTIDVLTRSSHIALNAEFDEAAAGELVSLLEGMLSARAVTAWLFQPGSGADERGQLNLVAFRGPGEFRPEYEDNRLAMALESIDHPWDAGGLVLVDEALAALPDDAQGQCAALGIGALVVFRLADHEQDYGIVRVDYGSSVELPCKRDLRLARGVVDQFSLGLGAIRLRERWMGLYRSSVEALAATVDAKDPYTHTHSRNVAYYSRLLAQRLGLPEKQVQQIELAGLLHDIGKISIADRILTKIEPLDPQERMEMMEHPARGAQILAGDEGLAELVPIVRHHHERHDGLGYPDGLSGDQIPLGAAIVGVADAVDTMLNDRSYARRRTLEEVRSEVRAASGTQFPPTIAGAVLEMIDEDSRLFRVRDDDNFDVLQIAGARDHLPVADVAQVRVISRLAQELSALTDLSTFVRGACSIVAQELDYDRVEICLDPVRPDSLSLGITDDIPCSDICRVISRRVIQESRVVNIPDLSAIAELTPDVPAGSLLAVPLRVEDDSIGSLCVVSEQRSSFTIVDEALLTVAANQLAAGLRVAQLHDEVKWSARHDALTQALNHGAFYEELSRAIVLHEQTGEPVSLILCDVEGLKGVNDRLGHLAGDAVLQMLVRRIRQIVRSQDVIARYGGDEFAVITFGTTRQGATEITRRLHESLRDAPLLDKQPITLVTTGIAQVGEDSLAPAELVRIADFRLYETRGRR